VTVSDALEQELRSLGLDPGSSAALSLLPLVQVAWADGAVQDAERALILEQAKALALSPDGLLMLGNWLAFPPSAGYLARGHAALASLLREAAAPAVAPTDVVGYCQLVARSAGGLFGVGATSRAEADAIAQVAAALGVGPDHPRPPAPPPSAPAPAPTPSKRVTVTFHTTEVGGLRAKACLVGEDGQRCPIDRTGIAVGRGRENDVQVAYDGMVSRRHCRLQERTARPAPSWTASGCASAGCSAARRSASAR
jgi:hypothetical protein